MRAGLFWLNDRQWARIVPHLPTGLKGPARDDERRIIGGIIHMLQSGARGRLSAVNTAYTTVYNCFNRWAKRGAQSLKRWPSLAKMPSCCRSVRLRSRLTGVPPAEKGSTTRQLAVRAQAVRQKSVR
jgi:transposase